MRADADSGMAVDRVLGNSCVIEELPPQQAQQAQGAEPGGGDGGGEAMEE